MPRYFLTYGKVGYDVVKGKVAVFNSRSKGEAIAKCQELNDWQPVDGDEQTFARQVKQYRMQSRGRRI